MGWWWGWGCLGGRGGPGRGVGEWTRGVGVGVGRVRPRCKLVGRGLEAQGGEGVDWRVEIGVRKVKSEF